MARFKFPLFLLLGIFLCYPLLTLFPTSSSAQTTQPATKPALSHGDHMDQLRKQSHGTMGQRAQSFFGLIVSSPSPGRGARHADIACRPTGTPSSGDWC